MLALVGYVMKYLAPLALVFFVGCAADQSSPGTSTAALLNGTPEAVGVLRFLNSPSVTFEMLDIDAALDRRAAANLLAHRHGPDGFYGTPDDNPFDSLEEVDAIKYVGPVAMDKIIAFADLSGFVPGPDDILGTFDGVAFTVAEADQTLLLANNESEGVLDFEIDLDSRAVSSILDARPISTMIELAELHYVGPAMLGRFKNYVATPAERIDCRFHGDCGSSGHCEGIPFDGSSEYGKCRPKANTPGAGNPCDANDECGPGLICGGLTLGFDMCIQDWQQDTFENTTQRFIPQDTTPFPVATSVTVRGQATVPMDIVVDIDLAHSDPHSLKIVLSDPNGAEAVLWDGPDEGSGDFPSSFVALGEISRDDMVNGRWLLRIWNVDGNGLGNLHGWSMWLTSNFD